MTFTILDCSLNIDIPEAEMLFLCCMSSFTISIVGKSFRGHSFTNFRCVNMSLYSWVTYFTVLILLYPQHEKVSEDPSPPLLKIADFYFSLDTRPNENPALKIHLTPINTTQPDNLITPLELNHIEFSALAYFSKGYPNKWGNFEVDVANGWQLKETRFFSFRPGNNGFRINTARVVPTNDSYIISRRTIVFRNIDPSTIKAITNAYDSYLVKNVSKMTYDKWRNTVVDI